jgi:hypothetical protein
MALLVPPHPGEPEPICFDYDWGAHQSALKRTELLRPGPAIPPRCTEDWNVKQAAQAERPLGFDRVLQELEALRFAEDDEFPDGTLPLRIATMSLWNLERDDLDGANRRGAAWVVIPTAMMRHLWSIRNPDAAMVIYEPDPAFFDRYRGDVRGLARLIDACYQPRKPTGRLRTHLRAIVDRSERSDEKKLIVEGEIAARTRPYANVDDDTWFGLVSRKPRRRHRRQEAESEAGADDS